ncbi:amidase, partial [Streptomyces violarus]|nr:amidase [Streptomyces violarus]
MPSRADGPGDVARTRGADSPRGARPTSGAGSFLEGGALPLAGVPIAVKGRHGLRAAGPLLAAGGVVVGATSVPGPGTP